MDFLKCLCLVAVVLGLAKYVEQNSEANDANRSTVLIRKEPVVLDVLYVNVAIFNQAFIDGVSGTHWM